MELLTVPEAASFLKLSKSQVYALCQQRVIPTITLGRSVRIPRDGLDSWLREQIHPLQVLIDRRVLPYPAQGAVVHDVDDVDRDQVQSVGATVRTSRKGRSRNADNRIGGLRR
jgi:excisionase family DNA binding protein